MKRGSDEPVRVTAPGEVADPAAPRQPTAPQRRAYLRPCVTWAEPYEPMSFGISCAKQPGNPPCNTGPFSS